MFTTTLLLFLNDLRTLSSSAAQGYYAASACRRCFLIGVTSAGFLTAAAVSMGDRDAKVPDLDLLAGIGAHRSPLTHTIVAGIVAEGLLLASADLSAEVHGRLPIEHDPLWDGLARIGRPLTRSLAIGTSAGLAYHLLVDALVQPGAYHDLPLSMPLEAHQTVLAINGVAEGVDASARAGFKGSLGIALGSPSEKSIGRRVVDAGGEAVAAVAAVAANGVKELYAALRRS